MMFKTLVLGRLHNMSDQSLSYGLQDRLSYARFVGLEFGSAVPDENTQWWYRDRLGDAMDDLFEEFLAYLDERCLEATKGHIVDSTVLDALVQRNSKKNNETIRGGGVLEGWEDNKPMFRQKDLDADWLVKNGKKFTGYKLHTNVDVGFKLFRRCEVTPVSWHDSRMLGRLLKGVGNTSARVYSASAYRSAKVERMLSQGSYESRINRKGHGNRPLCEAGKRQNRRNSKVRARVKHTHAALANDMGGKKVRGIGLVRARTDMLLMALAFTT